MYAFMFDHAYLLSALATSPFLEPSTFILLMINIPTVHILDFCDLTLSLSTVPPSSLVSHLSSSHLFARHVHPRALPLSPYGL